MTSGPEGVKCYRFPVDPGRILPVAILVMEDVLAKTVAAGRGLLVEVVALPTAYQTVLDNLHVKNGRRRELRGKHADVTIGRVQIAYGPFQKCFQQRFRSQI